MNVEQRQSIERRIVGNLVKIGLDRGYDISLNDGEEWTVKNSKVFDEIMSAIMTTDEDLLLFRGLAGERIGTVFLVYGNDGWDVIADHTANDAIDILVDHATRLTEMQ